MDILVLDSTRSVRANFATVISSGSIDFTCHYGDVDSSGSLTEANSLESSSGKTAGVTFSLISAPSAGVKRVIKNITSPSSTTASYRPVLSVTHAPPLSNFFMFF